MMTGIVPRRAAQIHLVGLVFWALLAGISAAWAAEPAIHKLGVRVRVSVKGSPLNPARDRKLTGMLVGLDDRAIILATNSHSPEVILPRQHVSGLELSLRRSQRRKGALIGTGVGLVGGALLGAASNDSYLFTNEASAGILGLLFAPIGMLTGMLVAPGERWQPVPAENIQLDPCNGLLGRRVRVSMAATFPVIANTEILTGELAGLSATAFTLNMSNAGTPVALARENITKLELSLQSGQRVKGSLIGLGIGVATGVLIGLIVGESQVSYSTGEKAVQGALVFGSAGTAIGAALAPGEWWHPIPLERIHP